MSSASEPAGALGAALRRSPGAVAVCALSGTLTLANLLWTAPRFGGLRSPLEAGDAAAAAGSEEDLTGMVSSLVLVPGNFALTHWYLWSCVTAGLTSHSVPYALLLGWALFRTSIKLEAAWGSLPYLSFVLVSTALTGLCSFLLMVLHYLVQRDDDYLFATLQCGQAGVVVAVAMGCVRVDVEDRLALLGGGSGLPGPKTRLALLPLLAGYTLLWVVLNAAGAPRWLRVHDNLFAWTSFLVSYSLIRSYDFTAQAQGALPPGAAHPSLLCTPRVIYADDPFALDCFFPDPARPFARAAGALGGRLWAATLGRCLGSEDRAVSAAVQQQLQLQRVQLQMQQPLGIMANPLAPGAQQRFNGGLTLGPGTAKPGTGVSNNPVADRRRARALKALDVKLAQISREPEVPLDGPGDIEAGTERPA
jgi:hypothetical protein